MLIDNDTAVLVIAAIADQPGDDGRYWAEFYPVDRVLALREKSDFLAGHPLLDIDARDAIDICAEYLRPTRARQLRRWTHAGRFVAVKRDRHGAPLFTWRKADDYLSQADLFWLSMIGQSAELVVAEFDAVNALADFLKRLYPHAERLAKRRHREARRDRKRARRATRRMEDRG